MLGLDPLMLTARVFDIHRGTTHDGPGMRTTVFFKGCPLACRWCQNPEGIGFGPQLQWHARKCIGCYSCEAACEANAITHQADCRIVVDSVKCTTCGACVEACPAKATTMAGKEYTVDELVHEAMKDAKFFDSFEGGVTASGGEPTSQAAFLLEFFKRLKAAGIRTALDTCGLTSRATLERLLPYTDCVLYDLKIFDSRLHEALTGKPNEVILQNLAVIAGYVREHRNVQLWIRTPLIPGATASASNICRIAQFIQSEVLDVMDRWELCAFNSLSREKYQKLSAVWEYEKTPLITRSAADSLLSAATEHVPADKVSVTGIVAENSAEYASPPATTSTASN
jgi:pyruvate formate lyase activating enzyme